MTPQALQSTPWQELAACRGKGHLFFSYKDDDIDAAKRTCRDCPVFDVCEREGSGEGYGVWAGKSEADRGMTKNYRRRIKPVIRCGMCARLATCRGLCAVHYQQWYRECEARGISVSTVERPFDDFVECRGKKSPGAVVAARGAADTFKRGASE